MIVVVTVILILPTSIDCVSDIFPAPGDDDGAGDKDQNN